MYCGLWEWSRKHGNRTARHKVRLVCLYLDAVQLVREESMNRFGMKNDRWTNDKRLGGRL